MDGPVVLSRCDKGADGVERRDRRVHRLVELRAEEQVGLVEGDRVELPDEGVAGVPEGRGSRDI